MIVGKKLRLPKREAKYKQVAEFFQKVDTTKAAVYQGYWSNITPDSDEEMFKRWPFAFMSVRTTWKNNIAGYLAIRNWEAWINDWSQLKAGIIGSRAGMHNNRAEFISDFTSKFLGSSGKLPESRDRIMDGIRDRLQDVTIGLGKAKTSFAIEMYYPCHAKLVCLDTHMFQVYGLDQTKDARRYRELEAHWVEQSEVQGIPPYIARCLFWDTRQGFKDSRYWSHVLEDNVGEELKVNQPELTLLNVPVNINKL